MTLLHPRAGARRWRAHDLDGQRLFFDRVDGLNVLLEDASTAGLKRVAPRTVQLALTNRCDKACAFCYRLSGAADAFTFDDVVALARFCDGWGVLELALGGGEPTLFPRFPELLHTLWTETGLCPNFTTNGRDLGFLPDVRGAYGQLQLSVYDEDAPHARVARLAAMGARFGLNYLVTPARVRTLEADVAAFLAHGACDILFLSYKGFEPALHLSQDDCRRLDASLVKLYELFGPVASFKVDVCWGRRLERAPRLFDASDCGAGVDFISITSDRTLLGCSFMAEGPRLNDFEALPRLYESLRTRAALGPAGCARRRLAS